MVVLAAAVVVAAFDAVDPGVAAVVAVPLETFSAGRASGTGCKVVRIAVDIFLSQIFEISYVRIKNRVSQRLYEIQMVISLNLYVL